MVCVICFVGRAGSGKDAACDYLRKEFGFHKVNMGSVIGKKLREKGLAPTHENKAKYALIFLKEFGDNYIIDAALADMCGHEKIAVSGVRRPKEMSAIKRAYPCAVFVEVFASAKKRAARRKVKVSDLLARDQHDSKVLGLGKVLQKVTFRINNNGTRKELYKKIDKVLAKINVGN